jgi:hypothetical protein
MTTASLATGSICLNFARGNCIRGHKCHWKHQVPTEDDELRVSMLKDVFGRGRHGTDKEEMDGTGNFNKNNRTIYLGGVVSKEDVRETERTVREDFQQFGELEYVRVIPSKAIGFVRFKLRVAAEFAREAMNGQTTPYGMISCKWAHVDPNPLAKEFDRRADEALAQYAIAKRILEMPEEKRASWKQMQMVQNGVYPTQEAPVAVASIAAAPAVAAPPGMPAIAAPAGVDPARAQAFAEYWAAFHAKKTAEQLGIEPPPEVQALAAAPAPVPAAVPPRAADVLTNPHTGETVEAKFAVNPYSQAPHPYAYRDYGWNRPKKNKSEAEKQHKQQKRSAQEAMQGGDYDAQQDPNYSYGPSAGGGGGARGGNKRSNVAAGPNTVTPGKASAAAAAPGPVLLPTKGKKQVVASQAEQEALYNDEPLAFGE